MGGRSSKSQSSHHHYPPNYGQTSSSSAPRYSCPGNSYVQPATVDRVQKKYSKIGDNYQTLNQVTEALAQAGLESSNLIVGIDFTKSNEWTASTHDQEVFSFYPDQRPCNGFEEALQRYQEIVPNLRLAGPTSFAPIIETAIGIVDSTGGQYHVLLIIADGQVTRSVDTQYGQLSPQERDTMNAIVNASDYPLSIVMVGVGDGPWDMMHEFDDNIPCRAFDNFQFVNFTEIMSRNIPDSRKEAEFALASLMEIPSQYKATIDLQLLGQRRGIPARICLPPPIRNTNSVRNTDSAYDSPKYSRSSSFDQGPAVHRTTSAAPSECSLEDKLTCSICLWQQKDLAFGCGHQTCNSCGKDMQVCPFCQRQISTRIRLY